MPKLAIVIPALGGTELLEEGLVSVLQHRPADAEVLVVLTEPYSDPYDLKDELRFTLAPRGAGLVECLQLGLEAAQAPLVHFLAAGRRVEEDWAEHAVRCFDDPLVAAVVPLTVAADQAGGAFAGIEYSAGGRRRRHIHQSQSRAEHILGPELRGAFYRRAALEAVGGLSGTVGDALADVEIALALRQAGYRVALAPDSLLHAPAGEPARVGALRGGLYAERLFWRNIPACGWLRSLLAHPFSLAAEAAQSGPAAPLHLLGRLLGASQLSLHRAQRKQLIELHQQPPALRPALQDDNTRRFDAAHAPASPPHARPVEARTRTDALR